MPDNLSISIGVDTAKLRADLEVLKAQFKSATADLKKMAEEASKTGDMTRVQQAAKDVDSLSRAIAADTRLLREQTAALRGVGAAATGASHGLQAAAVASHEMAEAHRGTSREVFTLSKDLGKLEISGLGVAKAFREIPRIAGPLAVLYGAYEAIKKFSNEGYKAITTLDDLSKASGISSLSIVELEKTFGKADVGFDVLDKMLRSVGESFDRAKVKAGDFGSMVSGVSIMRGGAGGEAGGVQVLRGGPVGPDGKPLSSIEGGGTTVFRGGGRLNIDPSKGFAGLVDPNQFRTSEEFYAAARRALLNIPSPVLQREILRGQGLDPVATMRGLLGSSAADVREVMPGALSDPRLRPGAVPLARRFGAQKEELGASTEKDLTEAGISAMEGAVTIIPKVTEAFEKLSEQIRKTREDAGATMKALTTGVDSGELGAATTNYADQWKYTFGQVQAAGKATMDYLGSLTPSLPGGGGQAGQVIPLAKASGGMIPGRGTGDTVPAMLTPGEFVNRRASVDYYGSGVFSALNNRMLPRDLFSRMGFAAGGLVGDRLHFADGGMVGTTSGGTPVHLHLDGQQFVMSAADHVASALVTASQRYQMRSAGTKPSWYGARPNG
jgi:hypothetical protein